jgi:putative membrane protein
VADIPIQRKEGRNIWPLLLGLLALAALLWFIFGRDRTDDTAAARVDSAAAAGGAVTTDSARGVVGDTMAASAGAMGTAGVAALGDADIANVIHEVNAGEIAAGKIAQTKASNAEVKSFAREMVEAHTALDRRSVNIAGQTGATNAAIRDSIVNANKTMSEQLQSASSGAAFDKAYIDGQVQAHQNALSFLQAAQGRTQNADLKNMIDSAIPDVQKHLDRAQSLQSKVGQ